MKKSQLLIVGGGALLAISTFLPFASMMGISISLFTASAGRAALMIALGAGAAGASYAGKGSKVTSIVSMVLGLIALIISGLWYSDVSAVAGLGMYLMLVSSLLVVAGGAMGMKSQVAATQNAK